MNERTARLRQETLDAVPTVSGERAALMTEFYKENLGRWSAPGAAGEGVPLPLRAEDDLDRRRGADRRASGGRGRRRCRPTRSSPATRWRTSDPRLAAQDPVPRVRTTAWSSTSERSSRTGAAAAAGPHVRDAPRRVEAAYDAGVFTEFMEQRAPGHTVLDGKIYSKGLLGFQGRHLSRPRGARLRRRPRGLRQARATRAMGIACDAAILFAERHAALAERMAGASATRPARPSCGTSPRSAAGCPLTLRATSTRRCRRTGSATWA